MKNKVQITHDTFLYTFGLSDTSRSLGLSTCACILAKINDANTGEAIVRPYTPVSTNAMKGEFQLLVKSYAEGKMSKHMENLAIGSTLDFKHIEKNVKKQFPFNNKHVTMLVGGTGITPMIQALHAILGTAGDDTKVNLIFGNKTENDILGRDLLEEWAQKSNGRLTVTHVLSNMQDDTTWNGCRGFIDQKVISEYSAPAAAGPLVMVCGPPPMYDALCGPRDAPELTGLLKQMGFEAEQVYKF